MRAIVYRLFANPAVGFELIVATLFANALALAAPIFVIQVLNRYVAFGVDTTLATLVAGAFIAACFEFAFRRVRLRLAERAAEPFDMKARDVSLAGLTLTPYPLVTSLNDRVRHQAVSAPDTLNQAYGPTSMLVMLDVPFSLFFIFVLWLLSPALALIAIGFAAATLLAGASTMISLKKPVQSQSGGMAVRQRLAEAALKSADTVRLFDFGGHVAKTWRQAQESISAASTSIASRQDLVQTLTMSVQAFMTVAMIGVGAYLVVSGQLDVGALVGANILAARAVMPLSRFGGMARSFAAAKEADHVLNEFARAPKERTTGTALSNFQGAIALDDVAFNFPGQRSLMFEHVTVSIEPGQTLAVIGPNGSGKSTFASLLAGMRDPGRGIITADGIDLQQILPEWWRQQISYLPQEPRFLPGTVRENLLAANPKLDDAGLQQLINVSGLKAFIDESANGLDMIIVDGGSALALGIRRRIALARALAVSGKVLIVDEPAEALDEDGKALVYQVMARQKQLGGTTIVCSHDQTIMNDADWAIDLSQKPQPRIGRAQQAAANTPEVAE